MHGLASSDTYFEENIVDIVESLKKHTGLVGGFNDLIQFKIFDVLTELANRYQKPFLFDPLMKNVEDELLVAYPLCRQQGLCGILNFTSSLLRAKQYRANDKTVALLMQIPSLLSNESLLV